MRIWEEPTYYGFIKREVKYEDESPVVSGWRSSLDDDASDWAIVPSGGSIGAIMRAHPIRSRPRSKGPYDRVAGSLPRVPMNFSETDPRFACRECFEDRGDNRFVCILCDMELWGHADCWAHIHTRRHQKAARYQTWENIENFIRERYGESLGKLGVFETPSKTLRCVHCEKSLQSYYDATRHVNSNIHREYMKHTFWHCEASAISEGKPWRRSEIAENLLRDMPDPNNLIHRHHISPTRDNYFTCNICGALLDCADRVEQHIASKRHQKKLRWL